MDPTASGSRPIGPLAGLGRIEPGTVIAGCLVEQVLGRGGMGLVLRARDGGPQGPPVAVKIMLEGIAREPRKLARFAREVDAARALDHEGIVKVLRADPAAPRPWIVMELVEGRTLDAVLADAATPLARRLDLLEQVCRAVHHAHERGILHRDLKPANVLVTPEGRAKVADFGLARDLSRHTRLTETGSLMGTPSYVSPEVVRGDEPTAASDVWALGVMLYEALTGRKPFTGGSPIELVRRIVDDQPAAPSRVARGLSAEHDRVALTALAKDPAGRPASALALARELHALRAGRRGRGPARASPWRVALPAAAAVVVVAAGALALSRRTSPAPAPPAPPVTTARSARPTEPPPVVEPRVEHRPADPLAEHLAEARAGAAAFDADRAEAAAQAALELDPASLEALLLRGRARDLRLDFVGAGNDLAQVVEQGKASRRHGPAYEALLLLAAMRRGAGEPDAAHALLGQAVALDPTRFEAYTRRGLLALYTGQKDGPTCRDDITEALRLAPDSSEALRNAAVLAWDDRRYPEAERLYGRALEVDPEDAEALDLRAWLHRDRGDLPAMRRDMQAALALFARLDDLAGHFVRRAREGREVFEADAASQLARGQQALAAGGRALGENFRHPLAQQELAILTTVDHLMGFERVRQADPARGDAALRRATQALDWALSINEGLWEAALRRAVVRTLPWSGRDARGALSDVELVLAARPDEETALRMRADLRRELGE